MDTELRTRHRAMWASGDYPGMAETFLLPLGPRLVDACEIEPGMLVLDIAAGTGNASIPAAGGVPARGRDENVVTSRGCVGEHLRTLGGSRAYPGA